MDDFKREIYMLARTLIEDAFEEGLDLNYGICCALEDAGDLLYGKGTFLIDDVPQEFPEFASLSDGKIWMYENYNNKPYHLTPKPLGYWWHVESDHKSIYGKKSPRISMLDHILSKQG